jgi:integrase
VAGSAMLVCWLASWRGDHDPDPARSTGWEELVDDLELAGLVRHGLRHTALTWMADAGVELHFLQRVAGHQDPAVVSRYLHPDHQAVLDVGRRT